VLNYDHKQPRGLPRSFGGERVPETCRNNETKITLLSISENIKRKPEKIVNTNKLLKLLKKYIIRVNDWTENVRTENIAYIAKAGAIWIYNLQLSSIIIFLNRYENVVNLKHLKGKNNIKTLALTSVTFTLTSISLMILRKKKSNQKINYNDSLNR
jgi:hypothetical protein